MSYLSTTIERRVLYLFGFGVGILDIIGLNYAMTLNDAS